MTTPPQTMSAKEKNIQIGTQGWLTNAENILAQLLKQAAAAQWWEITEQLAKVIQACEKVSKA